MNAVSHPEAVLFRAESDEQLVVRAKVGDDEALTALIQRYAPFVRMRAGAYGVKELDADDLYQEGMIALLSAVRIFCAGLNSCLRTFASVCINNKLNSALRAHMREKNAPMRGYLSLSEPEVPEEALTAHTLDPEQLVIQSEETDARNRRIETLLSLFERQVLKLYLSSYSYEEMSKQLGSSTKAVDNALQRVRRKLRTVFTLE